MKNAIAVASALLLAGCGGGTASGDADVSRVATVSGWEQVTYSAIPGGPTDTLRADLELGSLDGEDGGFVFGDVRGLEVSPAGEILVLDYQASEIHAFSPDGTHLGMRVPAGEGPFEISTGNGIFLDAQQSLWINDHGRFRFTRLLPDGDVETSFPGRGYGYVWEGVVADDGVLWEPFATSEGGVNREPGIEQNQVTNWMRRFDPQSGSVDSVRIGTSATRFIRLERGAAGIPFQPARLIAIDPGGAFWTAASSDRFSLTRISAAGDTLLQVELPGIGAAVTAEERTAEIERINEFMDRAGRISLDWDELLPTHKPILTRLIADDRGNAWALRETESGWMADVISATGEYLGRHVLGFDPTRFYPPVIHSGWFLTIRQGEFEEQYVVGSRLVPNQ